MQSIKIIEGIVLEPDKLPQGWCFYAFGGSDGYLYCGYSARLKAKLEVLKQKAEGDPWVKVLLAEADRLEVMDFDDALGALVRYKAFLQEEAPKYQSRLLPWENYVYLALDNLRFPFVSIQEHTNDDWQYIGPFRSRFFLADVMDTFSRILKIPYCETGSYPCDKLYNGMCRGWCQSLDEKSESEHSLDKLKDLLQEAFLHPNNGILELVQKERDAYFDDLEFAKADLLDDEIELLKDYRDWLNFLYLAKDLNYDSDELVVRNGMLAEAVQGERRYTFPVDETEYRGNERLALPLAAVDEMRMIYNYIRERTHV